MSYNPSAFYKQNGYYIAKQLLVKHLKSSLSILAEINVIISQQLQRLQQNTPLVATIENMIVHNHLKQLLSSDVQAYIASLKLCANLFSVNSLLMVSEIIETLKSFGVHLPVLQSSPVLHVMAKDLKIPGGYYGAGVHQDWPSLQGSLDTVIVWVPLMDVNKNNFPVELIPGSHLSGLYPGKVSDNIYEIDPQFYDENHFIPAELSFGDVLFISSFTLHRTGLTGHEGLRIACSTRYDNACEDTYIDRVYPYAQKRVVNREFIYPNFPEAHHIKKVFRTISDE